MKMPAAAGLLLLGLIQATGGTTTAAPLTALYWNVTAANLTLPTTPTPLDDYEAEAMLYAMQGLVNRHQPSVYFDLGMQDNDFPASDMAWKQHLAGEGVVWMELPSSDLCSLYTHLSQHINTTLFQGSVLYPSDGYSVYLALTLAGLDDLLPVSPGLLQR
jgi:hypothetical protein